MRICIAILLLLMLAGCSTTGCTYYHYTFNLGQGKLSQVKGVDIRIVPVDKSTTGAVTSTTTTSPTTSVTGIPGMGQ